MWITCGVLWITKGTRLKKLRKFMNHHINDGSRALPPWGHLMITSCIAFEQKPLISCCITRVDPKCWPLLAFRYLVLRMTLIIIITWEWESLSFRWMLVWLGVTWEWFSFASICSCWLPCWLICGWHVLKDCAMMQSMLERSSDG